MKTTKDYDYLIVGAGLYGATFARIATDRGLRCLVIDKRRHFGGNIYCDCIEGINVHKYGAHIFHTSNKKVWDFVNSFVPFNNFRNSPLALAPDGKLYNLPFNMNTFARLWNIVTPEEAMAVIERQRACATIPDQPRNLEEQALKLVGADIYNLLIKGYTRKQWGRPCSELPASIIRRLPVRFTYDNNYFNDTYQGIPEGGYNPLVKALLDGSDLRLGTDFFEDRTFWQSKAEKIVFTGRIDEFYNYCFGKLEYRTLRFETEILDQPNFQGNAVVNYTSEDVEFTRIIEHKHFESFNDAVYRNPKTVITREYPAEWKAGMVPFYPIGDQRNMSVFEKYQSLAAKEENVVFGGRLAEYKYYDMAPVVEAVMNLSEI